MSTTSNVRTTDETLSSNAIGWDVLTKRLDKSNADVRRDSLWEGKHHPLRWGLPNQARATIKPLLKQLRQCFQGKPKATADMVDGLEEWLNGTTDQASDLARAYQCLAWCYALPQLVSVLPAAPCHQLLERLCTVAGDAQREGGSEQPVTRQLLAGELGWALSVLLAEITSCRELRSAARSELSRGLIELHDGEGLPHQRDLDFFRPLLACWTRCLLLSERSRKSCLNKRATTQYEWAVTQAMRLSRADGGQVLTSDETGAWCKDLFAAMLQLVDDKEDRAIASCILPQGKSLAANGAARIGKRSPAVYSEWSELAVMRPEFKRNAPQLAVAFGEGGLRTELCVEGKQIWSGVCSPQIRLDGEDAGISSEWRELCWFSDDDVDYLEIEADLANDWVVQRQLALTRKDRLCYVADAVIGKSSAKIEYTHRLPLLEEVAFRPAEETCEGGLDLGRPLAIALPLALPEWRQEASNGGLRNTEEGLTMTLTGEGKGLYAPLLFALSNRHRDNLTWRRLTVAEHLQIQTPDVVAAYRIQLGSKQWVIYRSLAPTGNRTFLGQNLTAEFLFARFSRRGEVTPIVEIE